MHAGIEVKIDRDGLAVHHRTVELPVIVGPVVARSDRTDVKGGSLRDGCAC